MRFRALLVSVAALLAGCLLVPTSTEPPGKPLQMPGFVIEGPAYWDVLKSGEHETEFALTVKDLKVGGGTASGQVGTVIGKREPSALPLESWRSLVEKLARVLDKNTAIERFELNLDGTPGYQLSYDQGASGRKAERQTFVGARKDDKLYTLHFRRLSDDPLAERFDADMVKIINAWKWSP